MTIRSVLTGLVAACVLVAGLTAEQAAPRRFGFDEFSTVRRVGEPQFSPDATTIAVLVSMPNLDENRHVASLNTVDVATGRTQRRTATDYTSGFVSALATNGKQIRFSHAKAQRTRGASVLAGNRAAHPRRSPHADRVQQLAWSPDSRTIGFASADEPEKKPGYQRWNDSFDVQPNFHLFMTAPVPPTHVWMVPAAGGEAKRLTSGDWTLPVTRPPGAPSSMITWTPDGSAIVFARSGGGTGGNATGAACPGHDADRRDPLS